MEKLTALPKISPIFILLFLLGGLPTLSVSAQDDAVDNDITLRATAGIDGFYREGAMVPVQITVANDGAAVTGELRIQLDGGPANENLIYNAPISLPTRSNKRITLNVHFSGIRRSLDVDLVENGQTIDSVTTNELVFLDADDLLYGIVSSEPSEFGFLEDVHAGHSRAAVAFLGVENLPGVGPAWNSIDLLVLDDVDTSQLTAVQLQALTGWVNTGGQLIVTGGPNWQKTTPALADLLPVTVTGSETVADLPALSSRIGLPFRDDGPYLIATSSLTGGELVYHQDGLPILARQAYGRGHIYFLALDPKLAPLLDWDGSNILWESIATQVPTLPLWGQSFEDTFFGQEAVTSLPSLAIPSILQLVIFLLVYVIAIGPINYFVLKRTNRRELAWVTIPAIILIFTGATYITGFQLKGNSTIINQMSVAFGQVDAEQVRVHSLIGLYSPRRTTYDVTLPSTAVARPFSQNIRGVGSGNSNLEAITLDSNLTLSGVRVDVGSTEVFVADSYQSAVPLSGTAVLQLVDNNITVDINVRNISNIEIENAALMVGSTLIPINNLQPGDSVNRNTNIGSTSISGSGTTSRAVPGFVPSAAPGSSPLSRNADILLGTTDYYNDRDAFPRWQLLQAIENSTFGPATNTGISNNVVTFIGWTNEQQLDIQLDKTSYESEQTTLYFIEIPLQQDILTGNDISIPISFLNWELLGESNVFDPQIENLFLNGGWVEFEYQPWPDFQNMSVEAVALALIPQNSGTAELAPEVRLWHWGDEVWITIDDVDWGETAIPTPADYIGPGNRIRVRLQDRAQFGEGIQQVYPILTGDIE